MLCVCMLCQLFRVSEPNALTRTQVQEKIQEMSVRATKSYIETQRGFPISNAEDRANR